MSGGGTPEGASGAEVAEATAVYVQHQFENTYWERQPDWDYYDAALKGSSHLVLPAPLEWLTARIGLHHVHHLSPRIPNYRLRQCLAANPALETPNKVTIRSSWALTRENGR